MGCSGRAHQAVRPGADLVENEDSGRIKLFRTWRDQALSWRLVQAFQAETRIWQTEDR